MSTPASADELDKALDDLYAYLPAIVERDNNPNFRNVARLIMRTIELYRHGVATTPLPPPRHHV